MRQWWLGLTLLVAISAMGAEPAPKPNTLTEKERTDGWELLFDGDKFEGFRIEGEHQTADGVLIVGGTKKARFTTTRPLLRNFEFRLQYRIEEPPNASKVMAGINYELFKGGGSFGGSLNNSRKLTDPEGWSELVFQGKVDPITGQHIIKTFDPNAPGESIGGVGTPEKPSKVTVYFEVQPGGTLHLRNIKLKVQPMTWWDTPWPYVGILVLGLVVVGIGAGIVVWRLRRRWIGERPA